MLAYEWNLFPYIFIAVFSLIWLGKLLEKLENGKTKESTNKPKGHGKKKKKKKKEKNWRKDNIPNEKSAEAPAKALNSDEAVHKDNHKHKETSHRLEKEQTNENLRGPDSDSKKHDKTEEIKQEDNLHVHDWSEGNIHFSNKPKGISNLGNTCYMNSLLQVLSWTPQLGEQLAHQLKCRASSPNQKVKYKKGQHGMAGAVFELIDDTHRQKCKAVKRDTAFNILQEARKLNSQFCGHAQQDSFEIFNTIIGGIEDEETRERNKFRGHESRIDEPLQMTKLLGGTFITIYRYQTCGHIEVTFQQFTSISVPVPKPQFKPIKKCKGISQNSTTSFKNKNVKRADATADEENNQNQNELQKLDVDDTKYNPDEEKNQERDGSRDKANKSVSFDMAQNGNHKTVIQQNESEKNVSDVTKCGAFEKAVDEKKANADASVNEGIKTSSQDTPSEVQNSNGFVLGRQSGTLDDERNKKQNITQDKSKTLNVIYRNIIEKDETDENEMCEGKVKDVLDNEGNTNTSANPEVKALVSDKLSEVLKDSNDFANSEEPSETEVLPGNIKSSIDSALERQNSTDEMTSSDYKNKVVIEKIPDNEEITANTNLNLEVKQPTLDIPSEGLKNSKSLALAGETNNVTHNVDKKETEEAAKSEKIVEQTLDQKGTANTSENLEVKPSSLEMSSEVANSSIVFTNSLDVKPHSSELPLEDVEGSSGFNLEKENGTEEITKEDPKNKEQRPPDDACDNEMSKGIEENIKEGEDTEKREGKDQDVLDNEGNANTNANPEVKALVSDKLSEVLKASNGFTTSEVTTSKTEVLPENIKSSIDSALERQNSTDEMSSSDYKNKEVIEKIPDNEEITANTNLNLEVKQPTLDIPSEGLKNLRSLALAGETNNVTHNVDKKETEEAAKSEKIVEQTLDQKGTANTSENLEVKPSSLEMLSEVANSSIVFTNSLDVKPHSSELPSEDVEGSSGFTVEKQNVTEEITNEDPKNKEQRPPDDACDNEMSKGIEENTKEEEEIEKSEASEKGVDEGMPNKKVTANMSANLEIKAPSVEMSSQVSNSSIVFTNSLDVKTHTSELPSEDDEGSSGFMLEKQNDTEEITKDPKYKEQRPPDDACDNEMSKGIEEITKEEEEIENSEASEKVVDEGMPNKKVTANMSANLEIKAPSVEMSSEVANSSIVFTNSLDVKTHTSELPSEDDEGSSGFMLEKQNDTEEITKEDPKNKEQRSPDDACDNEMSKGIEENIKEGEDTEKIEGKDKDLLDNEGNANTNANPEVKALVSDKLSEVLKASNGFTTSVVTTSKTEVLPENIKSSIDSALERQNSTDEMTSSDYNNKEVIEKILFIEEITANTNLNLEVKQPTLDIPSEGLKNSKSLALPGETNIVTHNVDKKETKEVAKSEKIVEQTLDQKGTANTSENLEVKPSSLEMSSEVANSSIVFTNSLDVKTHTSELPSEDVEGSSGSTLEKQNGTEEITKEDPKNKEQRPPDDACDNEMSKGIEENTKEGEKGEKNELPAIVVEILDEEGNGNTNGYSGIKELDLQVPLKTIENSNCIVNEGLSDEEKITPENDTNIEQREPHNECDSKTFKVIHKNSEKDDEKLYGISEDVVEKHDVTIESVNTQNPNYDVLKNENKLFKNGNAVLRQERNGNLDNMEITNLPQSSREEILCFRTLHMPLTGMSDLERGLQELTEIEEFDESMIGCRKCKTDGRRKTEKKLLILSSPPVLVLQINKFKQKYGRLEKINQEVTYPKYLNLAQFCSSAVQIEELNGRRVCKRDLWYHLYGIVSHSGSLQGGHYTAYVRTNQNAEDIRKEFLERPWTDPAMYIKQIEEFLEKTSPAIKETPTPSPNFNNEKDEWYHISDSWVTSSTEKEALNDKNASMLLYHRISKDNKSVNALE